MQLGPDTVGHIYELLQRAQSSHPNTQKEAETALTQLDAQQGFSSCLAVSTTSASLLYLECQKPQKLAANFGMYIQEIIQNKQADHSARWLAGIYFKNKITKSWKGRPGMGYVVLLPFVSWSHCIKV